MFENEGLGNSLRFTSKEDKPLNYLSANSLNSLNKPIKPLNYSDDYINLRKELLNELLKKQQFRVAIGKSEWIPYTQFDERYNLREILNDEVVIEFDCDDSEIVNRAISQTGLALNNAGYTFEYWDHGGRSPHLHIKNLPIKDFTPDERSTFKKMFIRRYVPLEYLRYVDISLCGIHLIALEWAPHWKGKCGVKKLVTIFGGKSYA